MIGLDNLIKDRGAYKILIVDFQGPRRRRLRNSMRQLGFNNFREAADGDEGAVRLREEEFHLAAAGWPTIRMTGLTMLVAMSNDERYRHVPLLLIGADEEEVDADGCLPDNFDMDELEAKLSETIFRKLPPRPTDQPLRQAGIHLAEQRYEEAHAELDAAEKLDPRQPLVSYFRKLVFDAQGEEGRAEKAAETARRLFRLTVQAPARARAGCRRGREKLAAERADEAREEFDRALELDPDNPELIFAVGEACLGGILGEYGEEVLGRLARRRADDVYAYNRLGMIYRRRRMFDQAVAFYRRALELDPGEEYIMYNLARACLESGDKSAARDALRDALRSAPDFEEAGDLLGRLEDM